MSLQSLVTHIYHERQEEGSMMCAQHALNSLLQGNYFTAPDLSSIARSLDEEEAGYDDDNNGAHSTNMDDTGFFSVQVLVRALEVWNLDIVGWRGEDMRPYQNIPFTQLAFILNHHQHWYTLRRFGPASNHLEEDEGLGHWFNLNSLEPLPLWIGKNYLDIQIALAENEGYSVFAVVQRDREAPLALARTEADRIAATIPENATASSGISSATVGEDLGGFEDEDYELQAALQASMMGASGSDYSAAPPALQHHSVPLPGGYDFTVGAGPQTPLFQAHHQGEGDEELEDEPLDPVAASLARNRQMLQQITAEQQYAQRELASQGFTGQNHTDDYEEQIRQAIAESEAMARASGNNARKEDADPNVDMNIDMQPAVIPLSHSPPQGTFIGGGDRVYDDDDAELQAALRASLEHIPEGWAPPADLPPPAAPSAPSLFNTPVPTAPPASQDDNESVLSDDTVPSSDVAQPTPEAAVDVDEMRRRRLARFGG